MQAGFEALLWDKDGTLLDSFGRWIPRERRLLEVLCDVYGFPDAVRREAVEAGLHRIGVHGTSIDPHGELARGTEVSIAGAMAEALGAFGRLPGPDEFLAEVHRQMTSIVGSDSSPIPLRTGAAETLETVFNLGISQGLATSDTREASLRELSEHDLIGFFSFFAFGDTVSRPKPDPLCVYEFARQLGIKTSRILVVGDTPADAQMAAAAGARFCAVLGGTGGREDFPSDCTVLENPGDVAGLLK